MEAVASGGGADFHFYLWVDPFDTLGMGKDVIGWTAQAPIRCSPSIRRARSSHWLTEEDGHEANRHRP